MKLIVGLGNPGKEYENTRHNTGFLAMDELASLLNVSIKKRTFNALTEKVNVRGEQIVLMKPQTYMNNSGEAVGKAVRYYHLDPTKDVLVIYDDLDLPAGKIRLREKGSAGGHNGIKSIIAHLGTDSFCRIRVGIGSENKHDTIDFVLGTSGGEEKKAWLEAISRAAQAGKEYMTEPFQSVMNKYNRGEK